MERTQNLWKNNKINNIKSSPGTWIIKKYKHVWIWIGSIINKKFSQIFFLGFRLRKLRKMWFWRIEHWKKKRNKFIRKWIGLHCDSNIHPITNYNYKIGHNRPESSFGKTFLWFRMCRFLFLFIFRALNFISHLIHVIIHSCMNVFNSSNWKWMRELKFYDRT